MTGESTLGGPAAVFPNYDRSMILDALGRANSLEDLQRVIARMPAAIGVRHAVYHWVSSDGEQFGCGTYPSAWAQQYVENNYLQSDPVILACFQRFQPVDWRDLDWSGRPAQQIRKEAEAVGIGPQGYSVPIRGPNGQFALFTVSDDRADADWSDFTETWRADLVLIAHEFNRAALGMNMDRQPTPARRLSGREREVLSFLAMGYARGQIAEILSISEHTLRAYIESSRLKLDATNTVHAVARAVAEGHVIVGGSARAAPGNWPGRGKLAAE